MKNDFLLFIGTQSIISERITTFFIFDKKVTVSAPCKLMEKIIVSCDGSISLKQLLADLAPKWDVISVRKLINILYKKGIIRDARKMNDEMWRHVENPQCFPVNVTQEEIHRLVLEARERHSKESAGFLFTAELKSLGTLFEKRKSIRSFSNNSVSTQSFINVLWSAYGEVYRDNTVLRRVVPSAGALYPLLIHVVLCKQTANIESGVYRVTFGTNKSVGLSLVSEDFLQACRAFFDPIMVEKAQGVIVVSGSFAISEAKYGNRSLSYVSLEAGHVAQNIHLASVENGLATVEIGGFVDTFLAQVIDLPKTYHPLTTVVFGESSAEQPALSNLKFESEWAMPSVGGYVPPFAMASARLSSKRSWSHGRDASPLMAYTKATSEGIEWASCGGVPTLVHSSFHDLENVVDPRNIIKFDPSQFRLKGFPFKPFDEQQVYAWTKGRDEFTGSTRHILGDLVYFPYYPETAYYAYANSSGVAAHPDRQKAVETSVLELIERDSFMIAYLARLEFPEVSGKTLPDSIRARIRNLQNAGFRVWVKNHSLDLAPVICVFAQNERLACTTCASCSSLDIEHAVSHALMEVEAFVAARLQNGRPKHIKPTEVYMPLDHGNLYDQRKYFHKADFLIQGRKKLAFKEIGKGFPHSWQELLDCFTMKGLELLTIPLQLPSEYGTSNLQVIRSIVPGLVPMTFGYRQEPGAMERLYTQARIRGKQDFSYKEVTRFPHPFA